MHSLMTMHLLGGCLVVHAHREFGAYAVLGTEPATPVGNPEDVAAKTSMLRLMGKAHASDDGSLFDA